MKKILFFTLCCICNISYGISYVNYVDWDNVLFKDKGNTQCLSYRNEPIEFIALGKYENGVYRDIYMEWISNTDIDCIDLRKFIGNDLTYNTPYYIWLGTRAMKVSQDYVPMHVCLRKENGKEYLVKGVRLDNSWFCEMAK